MNKITAQDFYNYTKCKHRVYLDSNGNLDEKEEVSSFVEMLWEMGLQNEADYLQTLGDLSFENLETLSISVAANRTLELMQHGVALIYQGAIQAGPKIGRPDLLFKRDDHSSNFGEYYYEAVDIKAGKGWEEKNGKRTRFKSHYAFQVLFYREILNELQGYAPPMGSIINAEGQLETFTTEDFASPFSEAEKEVYQLVNGHDASEPILGSACHQCGWYKKCRGWVETHQDPTLLFFVGKNKFHLKKAGLSTIQDITQMDIDEYLSPPKKIPRMGKTSLERMKLRASVYLQGKPQIRAGYEFPRGKREIYFDIEDDPTQDHTYLYGIVESDGNNDWTFNYFLAQKIDDEESVIRQFWDFIAASGDAVFYVYSAKERSSLNKLMQRYSLDPVIFDHYVEHEYDLYTDLVVKYSDWPTYSYGIKNIARQVGFSWRDTAPGGANSIAWYNDYLSHPDQKQDVLQRILDYNEDDCKAMVAVKSYFERYSA